MFFLYLHQNKGDENKGRQTGPFVPIPQIFLVTLLLYILVFFTENKLPGECGTT
jgi:hypothetical protein